MGEKGSEELVVRVYAVLLKLKGGGQLSIGV